MAGDDVDALHVPPREVVAVLVTRRGRIGLFRRSPSVSHDRGLWHCVTGYLPPGATARTQAIDELHEETGLSRADCADLRSGPVLSLTGSSGDTWLVHTFACEVVSEVLTLDWEHDAFQWVPPAGVPAPGQVAWLVDVVDALCTPLLAAATPRRHNVHSSTRPDPSGH